MSEPTYIALITLSLPGMEKPVEAHVVLHPPDKVLVHGEAKPLGDCTLAELQLFADQLAQDVWATYQTIKLEELAENEHVEIKILPSGEPGEDNITILATEEEEETAELPPAPVETAVLAEPNKPDETSVAAETADSVAEPTTVETETADTQPKTPAEPETTEIPAADGPTPIVIPFISSQRVRVAGKRKNAGDPTWAAVDILLDEPVLRDMQAHALSSMNREVAGVMLGTRPEKQPDGRYLVHITDSIIAKHTIMQGASVTYTPESWRYMNDVLLERYPDETAVMVGWYHTHPGFGIFLSGMDKFIHHNFFTQIWHVAYVLDPQARKSGFFCWDRRKTQVNPVEFEWPNWTIGSW